MVSLRQAWYLGGQSYKGLTSGNLSTLMLPKRIDTSSVGSGYGNSIVESCLSVLTNAVSEPTIGEERDEGEIVMDTLPAKLLARPSQYMRGSLLIKYSVVSMNVWEHSIWFKQKSAVGRVVGLQALPPMFTWPGDGNSELATAEERMEWQSGTGPTITHFEYHPPHANPIRLETDEVVYLRQDVNPEDPKRGRSKLQTVLKEVLTDEEAAVFAASLLSNMGIPGVMLVPDLEPGERGPSKDEADAMAEEFHRKFSGPRRGRPLMMSFKVKAEEFGFNPRQMVFDVVRHIPEERISGALGVPALLAGLGAGLKNATYSNARELREFFTEQTVIPLWSLITEELTWQLGEVDFGGVTFAYDLTKVRALQEDQDALWERNLNALREGAITVAEFRKAVGLPELPNTDTFLRPPTVLELTAASNGGPAS